MYFVHTMAYIPLLSKLPEDTERLETTVIRFSGRNQLDAVRKDDRRLVVWGKVWTGFGPSEEDGVSVDVTAGVGRTPKLTDSVIGIAVGAGMVSSHGSMVVQGSPADADNYHIGRNVVCCDFGVAYQYCSSPLKDGQLASHTPSATSPHPIWVTTRTERL